MTATLILGTAERRKAVAFAMLADYTSDVCFVANANRPDQLAGVVKMMQRFNCSRIVTSSIPASDIPEEIVREFNVINS